MAVLAIALTVYHVTGSPLHGWPGTWRSAAIGAVVGASVGSLTGELVALLRLSKRLGI